MSRSVALSDACPSRDVEGCVVAPRFWVGNGSLNYDGTWKVCGCVVRVEIRRDALPAQSWVRAIVFSPTALQWNPLVAVPIQQAGCRDLPVTGLGVSAANFEADEERLLDDARAVLAAAFLGPIPPP